MFRSRGLASVAIRQGKVRVNGVRSKASRSVAPDDQIEIVRAGHVRQLQVVSLPVRRGPFREARQHYVESAASLAAAEAAAATRRHSKSPAPARRPEKRQRRQIRRFTGKETA